MRLKIVKEVVEILSKEGVMENNDDAVIVSSEILSDTTDASADVAMEGVMESNDDTAIVSSEILSDTFIASMDSDVGVLMLIALIVESVVASWYYRR